MTEIYDFKRMDILDCRALAKRIEDIESDRDIWVDERARETGADLDDTTIHDAIAADWAEQSGGDDEELLTLIDFVDEVDKYSSEAFKDSLVVRDSYFERYAMDYADDTGALGDRANVWPATFIDWPAAAKELQEDFTEVELDGVIFWVRS